MGCFAAPLGDCGARLTREHYVSESLLHELNRRHGLSVSGFPWQAAGEVQVLTPNALASKILCDRHNSALSALDATARSLFRAFDDEQAIGSGRQLMFLFSGHDLERWLLKVLCGLASSGNLSIDGNTDLSIPRPWLEVLFGRADLSNGHGLYVCRERGFRTQGPMFGLRTISGEQRLKGLGIDLCGTELILSMSGFPLRRFDGRAVVYRPLELHVTGSAFEKSVCFAWQGAADLGTVSFEI
ncbi:MAG: hypothetical protein ACYCX3_06695 [Thermoleophilia bacterium]